MAIGGPKETERTGSRDGVVWGVTDKRDGAEGVDRVVIVCPAKVYWAREVELVVFAWEFKCYLTPPPTCAEMLSSASCVQSIIRCTCLCQQVLIR